MQKIAFGLSALLSALLVIAAASKPSTAQSGAPVTGTVIQATAPHTDPPDARLHMHAKIDERASRTHSVLSRPGREGSRRLSVVARGPVPDGRLLAPVALPRRFLICGGDRPLSRAVLGSWRREP